jgi:hypothetical protein
VDRRFQTRYSLAQSKLNAKVKFVPLSKHNQDKLDAMAVGTSAWISPASHSAADSVYFSDVEVQLLYNLDDYVVEGQPHERFVSDLKRKVVDKVMVRRLR